MTNNPIPYRFGDPALLDEALRHRSAGGRHNERLEFLGDGVLNFVIAAELYRRCPNAEEGELSRLRASFVRGETLAELGQELGLGRYLTLGGSAQRGGGQQRRSILADAVEALCGAVYLDGGYGEAHDLIVGLYGNRLDERPSPEELKDPKTRLQEYLQAQGRPRPAYELRDTRGAAHERVFVVSCTVAGLKAPVVADGRSRRKAEQAAAERVLAALEAAH